MCDVSSCRTIPGEEMWGLTDASYRYKPQYKGQCYCCRFQPDWDQIYLPLLVFKRFLSDLMLL